MAPLLAELAGLVIDLRSGKSHKGQLARLLATAPRPVSDATGVVRIAQRGGLHANRTGEHTVELVVRT